LDIDPLISFLDHLNDNHNQKFFVLFLGLENYHQIQQLHPHYLRQLGWQLHLIPSVKIHSKMGRLRSSAEDER
jgi:hypothetical protein